MLDEILNKQKNPINVTTEQRTIYDKFLGHTSNPNWFPSAGMSPDPLGEIVLHHIHQTYIYPQGHANYWGLIPKIRDLLGCWIMTLSLLVPNIDNKVGGKKRKTNKRKRKTNKRKRKTNKKRIKFIK